MKYLKLFENFEDIHEICKEYGITDYTINDDGSIDVDGDVILSKNRLTKLPLKFNNVSGDFDCSHNGLTTLEGSPKSVGGHFWCYHNKLTTLEGGPQSVGGSFNCSWNKLTALECSPKSVSRGFYCYVNEITSFEFAPNYVGDFRCNDTPIWNIWVLFEDYSKVELLKNNNNID